MNSCFRRPLAFTGGLRYPTAGRLLCRAERAECGIDIACLLPYRAVIHTIDQLDPVPAGKTHPGRVARFLLHDHAEPREQEF